MPPVLQIAALASLALLTLPAGADGLLGEVREGVSATAESLTGTVRRLTDNSPASEKRTHIDSMARQALDRLLAEKPEARRLLDAAVGYAVFDVDGTILGFTSSAGGLGVAVDRRDQQRTYMNMAGVGAGLGVGADVYQLILLFGTEAAWHAFITDGLVAGAGGGATLGQEKGGSHTGFNDGVASFQVGRRGLRLGADVSGTKFWASTELNAAGPGKEGPEQAD